MTVRRRPVAEMLAELAEEASHGKIVAARLNDPRFHLDGLCDGDTVIIDATPSIVEVFLHELMHRRWRQWSERRVRQESRRLLANMTQDQIGAWYRRFVKLRRVASRAVKVETE